MDTIKPVFVDYPSRIKTDNSISTDKLRRIAKRRAKRKGGD